MIPKNIQSLKFEEISSNSVFLLSLNLNSLFKSTEIVSVSVFSEFSLNNRRTGGAEFVPVLIDSLCLLNKFLIKVPDNCPPTFKGKMFKVEYFVEIKVYHKNELKSFRKKVDVKQNLANLVEQKKFYDLYKNHKIKNCLILLPEAKDLFKKATEGKNIKEEIKRLTSFEFGDIKFNKRQSFKLCGENIETTVIFPLIFSSNCDNVITFIFENNVDDLKIRLYKLEQFNKIIHSENYKEDNINCCGVKKFNYFLKVPHIKNKNTLLTTNYIHSFFIELTFEDSFSKSFEVYFSN